MKAERKNGTAKGKSTKFCIFNQQPVLFSFILINIQLNFDGFILNGHWKIHKILLWFSLSLCRQRLNVNGLQCAKAKRTITTNSCEDYFVNYEGIQCKLLIKLIIVAIPFRSTSNDAKIEFHCIPVNYTACLAFVMLHA